MKYVVEARCPFSISGIGSFVPGQEIEDEAMIEKIEALNPGPVKKRFVATDEEPPTDESFNDEDPDTDEEEKED